MGFFDNRSDTEKELEEYYKHRKNQNVYGANDNSIDNNSTNNNSNSNYNNDIQNSLYNNSDYNLDKNHSEKFKIKGISGVIFLVWFISSMIGFMFLVNVNMGLALILFGHLFFFSGLFAFFHGGFSLSKAPVLIFPLVGAGVITGGIVVLIDDPQLNEFMIKILIIAVLILFILTGLGLIIVPTIFRKRKKQRCTYQTKATVIDLISMLDDDGERIYAPIYKYIYSGKEYIVREKLYKNVNVPKIGDEVDIFINEMNPNDFYIKDIKSTICYIIAGAMFVVFPAIALYGLFNAGIIRF